MPAVLVNTAEPEAGVIGDDRCYEASTGAGPRSRQDVLVHQALPAMSAVTI